MKEEKLERNTHDTIDFDLKQGVNKLNIKQLHNSTYGRIESLDHISHMEYRFGGDINIIIIFIIVCM